jgi:hypothetical protein
MTTFRPAVLFHLCKLPWATLCKNSHTVLQYFFGQGFGTFYPSPLGPCVILGWSTRLLFCCEDNWLGLQLELVLKSPTPTNMHLLSNHVWTGLAAVFREVVVQAQRPSQIFVSTRSSAHGLARWVRLPLTRNSARHTACLLNPCRER